MMLYGTGTCDVVRIHGVYIVDDTHINHGQWNLFKSSVLHKINVSIA